MTRLLEALSGHFWTIAPKFRNTLQPPDAPEAIAWRRRVDWYAGTPVYATGRYRQEPEAETLVVLVHGLGGCADSDYLLDAAVVAEQFGWSSLRLSLRGADRSGDDFYHGGLVDDLRAAVDDPTFDDYDRIFVVGYSLGGHVALRFAAESPPESVAAVGAVCSPLDLGRAQKRIDRPSQRPYRIYLLRELRQVYAAVARKKPVPTPVERIRTVRKLREWDALTVVPRFGFLDVDDYYDSASVASRLEEIEVPCHLVASRRDPLVGPEAVEPALDRAGEALQVDMVDRGGHVYFPPDLDLGAEGPKGLVPQLLTRLSARTDEG